MKLRRFTLITAALVTALSAATPDVRELYEQARALQESNQNLREAIRLYGQVIELARGQHPLAARAQYEQGLLYARLGRNAEAHRAFRAIVANFSDQKSIVALAMARLPASRTDIAARRVWAGPDADTPLCASPDGRSIAFTDWSTGDLAIHDLTTGANRRLTRKAKSWAQSGAQAVSGVFSPDGRQIAYVWLGDEPDEVRVTNLSGSGQRTLYRAENVNSPIQIDDWSADGKYLLASIQHMGRDLRMVLIPTTGEPTRELAASPRRRGAGALFSRDGKYVVYDVLQQADSSPGGDIRILSIVTGKDGPLIQHPANDIVLGWSPDGSKVLFSSDRSGSMGIWALTVANGQAQGSPEPLKLNLQVTSPLGVSRQGSLFFVTGVGGREVYLAELDPQSGRILGPPTPLDQRFVGVKRSPAWSPDGMSLAYLSPAGISIHPTVMGQERDVFPKVAGVQRLIKWHPDGKSIFVTGTDRDGTQGLLRVDLQTGETEVSAKGVMDRPAFSADASTIFYGDLQQHLISHNLISGKTKILDTSSGNHLSNPDTELSPDGKWIAYQVRNTPAQFNSLVVIPSGGGTRRTLLSIPQPQVFGGNTFVWTPDMRYILASRTFNDRSVLLRVPVDGSAAEELGLSMPGKIVMLRLQPNGPYVAFLNNRNEATEVWTLDNFLPRVATVNHPDKR